MAAKRMTGVAWIAMAVVAVAAVATALVVTLAGGDPPRRAATVPAGAGVTPGGPPVEPVATLHHAGPLAVSPAGALYVVDGADRVLVRLANGGFQRVAGDGTAGFSGDGGSALSAELSAVAAIAFAPNGDLYLADGGRVRWVDRSGIIHTLAGTGGPAAPVTTGTPARAAHLGTVTSVAFSPGGQLYVTTTTQLLRVFSGGSPVLVPIPATLAPGGTLAPGAITSFASLAVDGQGDIVASSAFDGWSVFRIAPGGAATYLGHARRSGGSPAVVQRGPDGVIEVADGAEVSTAGVAQLQPAFSLAGVPGITGFVFPSFFALAPDGTCYADNLGPPAFEPVQQIVAVAGGRGTSLWSGIVRA